MWMRIPCDCSVFGPASVPSSASESVKTSMRKGGVQSVEEGYFRISTHPCWWIHNYSSLINKNWNWTILIGAAIPFVLPHMGTGAPPSWPPRMDVQNLLFRGLLFADPVGLSFPFSNARGLFSHKITNYARGISRKREDFLPWCAWTWYISLCNDLLWLGFYD